MRRTLSIKRETLDVLDHGDLEQIVAASVSCPIDRALDAAEAAAAALLTIVPNTNIPTVCHCP